VRVVVPFDVADPKTRLSGVLSAEERGAFARVMLDDVLEAVWNAGHTPEVLATEPLGSSRPVRVDERPLSAAVNAAIDGAAGTAVLMADLPLLTPETVERLLETPGDVAIAPGRGGGTNGLVVRHPDFRVDYHGVSCRDHRRIAREVGAETGECDSFRLATDIDEPADLVELLLHGEGESERWLRERGFSLDAGDGRVAVRRD
jgi:2-phospho-L-lactate guanylyltransferase